MSTNEKRLKVMQILPRMNVGGVERGVVDLVRFFKGTLESSVVSGGGRLVAELERLGVAHHCLPVYAKSPSSVLLISQLRRLLCKEATDIIHGRSRVPAWIAFFASRKTNTHFVTTAHGLYRSSVFSNVMGWGKFVICPSKVVARHMKERFGVPEEKIVIINRWVDLEAFKFTEFEARSSSNTIVSIGRISPSKGYEYLIEAFKKLARFNSYLSLKIVGSPDPSKLKYYKHLQSLVNRYSLHYNVQFVGVTDRVESILRGARLLVAPSVIEESFGRVVVEAMACGVPVVATKVGGFNEIIDDGVNGITVEAANSAALTEAMLKVLQDKALSKKFAENGRAKVEKLYSMDKCLNETLAVYRKTVSLVRILVVKLASLGDVILAIPSLKALRVQYPDARISLLISKKYALLMQDCPYIDEVITVEADYKKFKRVRSIASDLRRRSFDYIVDLQNNHASHAISSLSFPRYSFGYSRRWGFLLSKHLPYSPDEVTDPLSSQEKILELLGVRMREKKLVFWEKKPLVSAVPPYALESLKGCIGINIGASPRWQSKNWPAEHIMSLIELINKNFPARKAVLFGDESTRAAGEKLENYIYPKPLNLCAKTSLADLPSALRPLSVFVTPDTATLHLAQALGVPTIALFGPTDPVRHTVKSESLHILNERCECSFCYKPKCTIKEAESCMKKISPQSVFSKIKEILASA